MNKSYILLDSKFNLEVDSESVLNYIDAFMDAYDNTGDNPVIGNNINIVVRVGKIPSSIGGEKIKIHSTKHEYWNFYGEYLIDGGVRIVLWPSRRVVVSLSIDGNDVQMLYAAELKPNFAGEALFHVMRSLALYKRDSRGANFLHASGVIIKQNGVVFTGAVSAGKTTLLLECVQKLKAKPLSNDRIFIKSSEKSVTAYSWPSYASFCEGTILNFPRLTAAALSYQLDENNRYRTLNWDNQLSASFEKDAKRIYPMQCLSDCIDSKYARSSKINHLIISRLDINCAEDEIRELSYEKDYDFIIGNLRKELVDTKEPSFEPWHGLSLNMTANSPEKLIENLSRNGCKVSRVYINPLRTDKVISYLREG